MSIQLTIDGQTVTARPGATLLEAVESAGIDLPRLCHVPGLASRDVCRLCLVRVDGRARPVPACSTPATPRAAVTTGDDDLVSARRAIVSLILGEHGSCGRPECEIEALGRQVGVAALAGASPDDSTVAVGSDYIEIHPQRCVHCDRCLRGCEHGLIGRAGRGVGVGFVLGDDTSLRSAGCPACGDCIALCPAGVFVAPS